MVAMGFENLLLTVIISDAGFTAPGAFLFELLARLGITDETVWPMLRLMESATTLLTDESASAGRRRVCKLCSCEMCQRKGACSLRCKSAERAEGTFQQLCATHAFSSMHANGNCRKQA